MSAKSITVMLMVACIGLIAAVIKIFCTIFRDKKYLTFNQAVWELKDDLTMTKVVRLAEWEEGHYIKAIELCSGKTKVVVILQEWQNGQVSDFSESRLRSLPDDQWIVS